jgi:hypothetical protein
MLAILPNIAARTAQALAWLGSQGTRAIAALVFIGIAVPPLGELLKPYVTEAIFALLCLSFLRVDLSACEIICAGRALFSPPPHGRWLGCLYWRARLASHPSCRRDLRICISR